MIGTDPLNPRGRELRGPLFDEPTLLRVGHRLKAGVCAKLAVDVVEVIAECLGGDAQLAGDGRGVAAFSEELQDTALLIGERLDWGVMCEGRNSTTIARKLSISAQTLRNHLHHINRKLRTHTRLEAVTHAQQRGLIE